MALHDRLRTEVEKRIEVAKAATPGPWRAEKDNEHAPWLLYEIERFRGYRNHVYVGDDAETAQFIALHDPADAIRRYEAALRVLKRHAPIDDPNQRPGVRLICADDWGDDDGPHLSTTWPCSELRDVAASLGVDLDD